MFPTAISDSYQRQATAQHWLIPLPTKSPTCNRPKVNTRIINFAYSRGGGSNSGTTENFVGTEQVYSHGINCATMRYPVEHGTHIYRDWHLAAWRKNNSAQTNLFRLTRSLTVKMLPRRFCWKHRKDMQNLFSPSDFWKIL